MKGNPGQVVARAVQSATGLPGWRNTSPQRDVEVASSRKPACMKGRAIDIVVAGLSLRVLRTWDGGSHAMRDPFCEPPPVSVNALP
jgi:hypothetical protein